MAYGNDVLELGFEDGVKVFRGADCDEGVGVCEGREDADSGEATSVGSCGMILWLGGCFEVLCCKHEKCTLTHSSSQTARGPPCWADSALTVTFWYAYLSEAEVFS